MLKSKSMAESMPKMPKRISIEEAENGFVVSSYTEKGEKQFVCKDKQGVLEAMDKLGMGKMVKEDYEWKKSDSGMMKVKK